MARFSVWYLLLLHHSQTTPGLSSGQSWFGTFCFYIILKQMTLLAKRDFRFGTFCFYIILKRNGCVSTGHEGLVPSAFTSFSNRLRFSTRIIQVWYLLLLHHSQTRATAKASSLSVWYLLLLHHSQTLGRNTLTNGSFGTFCFYIILKRAAAERRSAESLVPSAFTSFSNPTILSNSCWKVWYLLLLHHSQTFVAVL